MTTKQSELLQFINSKKRHREIDMSKYLKYFCTTIRNAFIKTQEKGLDMYILSCLDIVFHVWLTIFSYTRNKKLSMFFCDRATLLFNEYVHLALNSVFFKEKQELNMIDIKCFVYKKTIGPLKITSLNVKLPVMKCLRRIAHLYVKLCTWEDYITILEQNENYILKEIITPLFKMNDINIIESVIELTDALENETLTKCLSEIAIHVCIFERICTHSEKKDIYDQVQMFIHFYKKHPDLTRSLKVKFLKKIEIEKTEFFCKAMNEINHI